MDIENQAKIIELQEKLDKLSNEINLRIEQEESFINAMNFGLRTVCFIANSKGHLALVYDKFGGKWKIGIIEVEKDRAGKIIKDNVWQLDQAPRSLRLYGLKHIEELKLHIVRHAESVISRLEKFLYPGNTGEENNGGEPCAESEPLDDGFNR